MCFTEPTPHNHVATDSLRHHLTQHHGRRRPSHDVHPQLLPTRDRLLRTPLLQRHPTPNRHPQRLLPRLRRIRSRPHPKPRLHSRRPQQIPNRLNQTPLSCNEGGAGAKRQRGMPGADGQGITPRHLRERTTSRRRSGQILVIAFGARTVATNLRLLQRIKFRRMGEEMQLTRRSVICNNVIINPQFCHVKRTLCQVKH